MEALAVVLIVVLLLAIVAIVSAPLRANAGRPDAADSARRADLEAAKDAKYHEIRDAEMDYRTGKLSESDYRVLDRTLRAEAVAILHELDRLGEQP
jgi:hypothetical protein